MASEASGHDQTLVGCNPVVLERAQVRKAPRLGFRARFGSANERDAAFTVHGHEMVDDGLDADTVVDPDARHVGNVDTERDDRHVREALQPIAQAVEPRVVREAAGKCEHAVDARPG